MCNLATFKNPPYLWTYVLYKENVRACKYVNMNVFVCVCVQTYL